MKSKELISIGFFKELYGCEQSTESIKDYVSDNPHPDEKKIIQYLNSSENGGIVLCGPVKDEMKKFFKPTIGGLSISSDGNFQWRSDLPYYIKKYHIKLPEEFIEHMRKHNWTCKNIEVKE